MQQSVIGSALAHTCSIIQSLTLPYLWGDCNHIGCSQHRGHTDFGLMRLKVHSIFNHYSIASGFSDFHLYCASLKPSTRMAAQLDLSRLLPRPRHDEQPKLFKAIDLCKPGPSTINWFLIILSLTASRRSSMALLRMLSLTSVAKTQETSLPAL